MDKEEIEALVKNIIDAYEWIKNEIGEVEYGKVDKEEMKRLLSIPGFKYFYDFGRVKQTYERLENE